MTAAYEQWKPQINLQVCTGCKQCIAVCPTNVLEEIKEKAQVVRPENCSYCLPVKTSVHKRLLSCHS